LVLIIHIYIYISVKKNVFLNKNIYIFFSLNYKVNPNTTENEIARLLESGELGQVFAQEVWYIYYVKWYL